MDLKGGRLSEVLLPHEGVRKRLCAWRDRAALKDFADAAAAGDDPATALPLPAAEDQDETGDDDDEEAEAKKAEADGAKAVAARPIDWQRDGGEDDELPDFNAVGGGAAKGGRGGASWWGE